jgi:hypothetical protein
MAVVVIVGVVMGAGISADVTVPSWPRAESAGPYFAGTEALREWVVVSPGDAHMWAKVPLTRRARCRR